MSSDKRQLLYEIKQTNQTLSLNWLIKLDIQTLTDILAKEKGRWGK